MLQQIRSLSEFRNHISRDHKHLCKIENCTLRFACKAKLEEHCLTVHQTNIKVDRTCPKCQNVIRGLNDYFRHIEKDHRFACHMCTLRFANRLKFEEHLKHVISMTKLKQYNLSIEFVFLIFFLTNIFLSFLVMICFHPFLHLLNLKSSTYNKIIYR